MAQNQVSKQDEELPSKTLSPMLEWGHWFLWILTSVTAGGLAISYIFFGGHVGYGVVASFGGVIGGIIVGWMPWFAQKYPVSNIGWWICAIVSMALTVIAVVLVFFMYPHLSAEKYIGYLVFPSVLGSSLIGTIAREIGQRKLKSQATWWQWALAIVLIFIIGFAMISFGALMSLA